MGNGFDFRGRVTEGDGITRAMVRQAQRAYCEENGHSIHRSMLQRNAYGTICISSYSCENCDITVTLSYPD